MRLIVVGNRSSIQKYYRILFSLPKPHVMIISIGIIMFLIFVYFSQLFVAVVFYSISSSMLLYFFNFFDKNPFSKPRRVIGFLLFYHIFAVILLCLAEIMGLDINPYSLASFSISLLSIVLIGGSGLRRSTIAYLIASSMMYALAADLFSKNASLWISPVYVFTPLIISVLVALYVKKHYIKGVSILDVGRYFVRYKLDRERTIEEMFEAVSSLRNISSHILASKDFALVYTDVHYGPFGDIGSGDLPSVLAKTVGKRHVIILHGMGSHERNIASKKYSMKYVEAVLDTLKKSKPRECIPLDTFKVEKGDWEALACVFSCITLLFLTRKTKGIDDLPYSIQEYASRRSIEECIQPILVIDSHNGELVEEPNLATVYELVDEAIDLVKSITVQRLDYGFAVNSTSVKNTPGVIGEKITLLVLKTGDKKTCILYLPGNNMEPGVRDKLIDVMVSEGCNLAEVVTNDEHRETGVLSKEVYRPIEFTQELASKVRLLVKETVNRHVREELMYYTLDHETLLMGNSIWKLKWFLEKFFYKLVIIDLFNVLFIPLILILIFPSY